MKSVSQGDISRTLGLRIARGKVTKELKEAREAAENFLKMTSGGFED